jgi:hypothetical protein
MRGKKKQVPPHPNQFIAIDQDLNVFAGYDMGHPIWSANIDDYKPVNNTTHLKALRNWFPNKTIELTLV